ncbi:hypothetical protein Ade02nite_81080 [Paractinoplanes deccanensis]|uniref:NADH dehydrogenase subunit 6 n=1 Tax=Paractinoplanes deccanensis TaxID=113561 RepID=A0ABQ3YHK8_9ACTN|nr:hypothetical protein Ade02nite_81080 [Actinoplanes deccanensis]
MTLSGSLTIVISAIVAFYLLWRRRSRSVIVHFVMSAVLSVMLGIGLWRLVALARVLVSV